jgi:hypothetical protein
MESNVFPLTSVKDRFEQFELVKLYTDDGIDGPDNQVFQFQLTGTVALPTYAIVDPETGTLLDILSGYASEEEFAEQFTVDVYGEPPAHLVVDWTATWESNLRYDFSFNDGYVFNNNY